MRGAAARVAVAELVQAVADGDYAEPAEAGASGPQKVKQEMVEGRGDQAYLEPVTESGTWEDMANSVAPVGHDGWPSADRMKPYGYRLDGPYEML